jgi:hypothetical protein
LYRAFERLRRRISCVDASCEEILELARREPGGTTDLWLER